MYSTLRRPACEGSRTAVNGTESPGTRYLHRVLSQASGRKVERFHFDKGIYRGDLPAGDRIHPSSRHRSMQQ